MSLKLMSRIQNDPDLCLSLRGVDLLSASASQNKCVATYLVKWLQIYQDWPARNISTVILIQYNDMYELNE